LRQGEAVVRLLRRFPFKVDLAKAQNRYYRIMESVYADFFTRGRDGEDPERAQWLALFQSLGRELRVKVQSPSTSAGA
jgi:hypothetical protein